MIGAKKAVMKRTIPCSWILALALALSATPTGCGEDGGVVRPPDDDPALSLDLRSNCYSWPEQEFSPDNIADLRASLPVESAAVEFSLQDLDGNTVRLSALLESRPVLLVLGSFT